MRPLASQVGHGTLNQSLQTLKPGQITQHTSVLLSGSIQQLPQRTVGQTQCSEAAQVVGLPFPVRDLQEELTQGLGLCLLLITGLGPVAIEECRHWQRGLDFVVQTFQLAVDQRGRTVLRLQGSTQGDFDALGQERLLIGQLHHIAELGSERCLASRQGLEETLTGTDRLIIQGFQTHGTKRTMQRTYHLIQQLTQVALEANIQRLLGVTQALEQIGHVHIQNRIFHGQGALSTHGLTRLFSRCHQTGDVGQQRLQASDLDLLCRLVRTTEQNVTQYVGQGFHGLDQHVARGLGLQGELVQYIPLETLVGHTPGHKLLHVGQGIAVPLSQFRLVGHMLTAALQQHTEFSHQISRIRQRLALLGQIDGTCHHRVNQLVHQQLGRHTRTTERIALDVQRVHRIAEAVETTGRLCLLLGHTFRDRHLRRDIDDLHRRIDVLGQGFPQFAVELLSPSGAGRFYTRTQDLQYVLERRLRVALEELNQLTVMLDRRLAQLTPGTGGYNRIFLTLRNTQIGIIDQSRFALYHWSRLCLRSLLVKRRINPLCCFSSSFISRTILTLLQLLLGLCTILLGDPVGTTFEGVLVDRLQVGQDLQLHGFGSQCGSTELIQLELGGTFATLIESLALVFAQRGDLLGQQRSHASVQGCIVFLSQCICQAFDRTLQRGQHLVHRGVFQRLQEGLLVQATGTRMHILQSVDTGIMDVDRIHLGTGIDGDRSVGRVNRTHGTGHTRSYFAGLVAEGTQTGHWLLALLAELHLVAVGGLITEAFVSLGQTHTGLQLIASTGECGVQDRSHISQRSLQLSFLLVGQVM